MNGKTILPLYAAILITAFAVISLLVIVSRGHPWFIARKLRLGALLLTLTSASIGCRNPFGPTITCYDPIPPNRFVVDQADVSTNTIALHRSLGDTLSGRIEDRIGTKFSYAVVDSQNGFLSRQNISAFDGAFDASVESFKIAIDKMVKPGTYQLRFYNQQADSVENTAWYNESYVLTIVDK
jgi:hypothetical protein